ncbi:hypothetical protein ATE49_15565 [Elizabethkingia miricola]|uniref:DUF2971 domain-containing protein n=1 Tax=Elizabethkingia miricola TaxID=172045 RepID=A0ABY3NAD8_ELIMR|nr:DUF2971 domain-containing protein [Elizabethkingia miricola]OBS12778.1 hypothetical protein ATE49_15565 [Elizabethkingia miricola]TYO83555.1 Protein of unknown function (DUF2971) [Elizabethkingia miricola]
MGKIYYKYRDLNNFKRTIDIILNKRLYFPKYSDLNDLWEGTAKIIIDNDDYPSVPFQIPENNLRVCCFSNSQYLRSMWSLYADSHKGIAIGFTLDNPIYTPIEVEYIEKYKKLDINRFGNEDYLTELLKSKRSEWRHEEESRIIANTERKYISINIKHIYLGVRISEEDKDIVKKLIEKIDPSIKVTEVDKVTLFNYNH